MINTSHVINCKLSLSSQNKRYEIVIIFIKVKSYEIILNKIFPFFFEKDLNSYLFNIINRSIYVRQSLPKKTRKISLLLDFRVPFIKELIAKICLNVDTLILKKYFVTQERVFGYTNLFFSIYYYCIFLV